MGSRDSGIIMVRKSEIALMRRDFGTDPPEEWYECIPHPPAWSLVKNRMSSKKVLDIGACTGWISRLAQKEGGIVISTDIYYTHSKTGLSRATCDKEMLPFRDCSFDFVLTANTLHHGDLQKTAIEAHRVLRDGGELVSLEEPCIPNNLKEIEYLNKVCGHELELGIDERRPNMDKYKAALVIFRQLYLYSSPIGIFATPCTGFSKPVSSVIHNISTNSYHGGIAIRAVK